MKPVLFLLGIVLAALGFLAAGAELAAQAMDPNLDMLPAASDVWRTVSPTTYEAVRPLEGTVWMAALALPGWLTLGVPGLALMFVFRARGEGNFVEHEESLFLFDELARQAREQGYDGSADDMRPSGFDDTAFADDRYAQDDVADDLLDDAPEHGPEHDAHPAGPAGSGHDYLLERKTRKPAP